MKIKNKILIAIIMFCILTILPIYMNNSNVKGFKLNGYTTEIDKNKYPYYYLMHLAGTVKSGSGYGYAVKYSSITTDEFFTFAGQSETKGWNFKRADGGVSPINGKSGNSAATDYSIATAGSNSDNHYRMVCVYEQKGMGNLTDINLHYALMINPKGNDPYETTFWYKKNPSDKKKGDLKSDTVRAGTNYLVEWAYVMAKYPRAFVENYAWNLGGYVNDNINHIANKTDIKNVAFENVIVNKRNSTYYTNGTNTTYKNDIKEYKTQIIENVAKFGEGITVLKEDKNTANKKILGPYKLDFVYGDKLGSKIGLTVKDKDNNKIDYQVYYDSECKKSFKIEDLKPDTNFYIKLEKKCEDGVTLTFNNTYTLYGAMIYFLSGPSTSQDRVIYKPFYNTVEDKQTIKNEPVSEEEVIIKFFKQGDGNNGLKGVKIKLLDEDRTSNLKISNKLKDESNKNGYLGYLKITPPKGNTKFQFTIQEEETAKYYKKDDRIIKIVVEHDKKGNITKISAYVKNDKNEYELSETFVKTSINDGTGKVYIKNARFYEPFTIEKVDFYGNPIKDVEFQVTLNNIRGFVYGGELYVLKRKDNDDGGKIKNYRMDFVTGLEKQYEGKIHYVTFNSKEYSEGSLADDGIIAAHNPNQGKDDDYNRITLTKIKTNKNGRINLKLIPNSRDYSALVYITEKGAENEDLSIEPRDEKYMATLTFSYEENKWKMKEPKQWNDKKDKWVEADEYCTVDASEVKIKIKNEVKINQLRIVKNIPNAVFKCTVSNTSSLTINKKYFNGEPDVSKGTISDLDDKGYYKIESDKDNNIVLNNLITKKFRDDYKDEDGIPYYVINFANIVLNKDNNLIISLEEKEVPEGYKKIDEKIKLTIEKVRHGFKVVELKKGSKILFSYDMKNIPEGAEATDDYWYMEDEEVLGAYNFKRYKKAKDHYILEEYDPGSTDYILLNLYDDDWITPEYVIEKQDFKGNKLQDVGFNLYFNNIRAVTINGKEYNTASIAKNEYKQEDGSWKKVDSKTGIELILKDSEEGGSYDRLSVNNVKTDKNGQITINSICPITTRKTVYMNVTEKSAGEDTGIIVNSTPLRLLWRYDNKGSGKWELFERKDNGELERFDTSDSQKTNTFDGSVNAEGETKPWWTLDRSKSILIMRNKTIPGISINDDATTSGVKENITKYEKTTTKYTVPAPNVEFTATFSQTGSDTQVQYGKSDANGDVKFYYNNSYTGDLAVYYPQNITNEVKVKIHEVPSEQYEAIPDETYTFKFNNTTKCWERKDDSSKSHTTGSITYSETLGKVENPVKVKLTLEKKDHLNSEANMDGAVFEFKLTNVSKVNGAQYEGEVITKTVTDGKIVLELEMTYADKPVNVKLKETQAPPENKDFYYKAITDEIEMTITREKRVNSVSNPALKVGGYEIVTNETVDGAKISFVMNNISYIDIDGKVWVDAQQGEKSVTNPDGTYTEGEPLLKDVNVYLYSEKDGKNIRATKTNNNGEYEFKEVIRTKEGYKVYFEYNGILYYADSADKATNASEFNRSEFNSNFKTITNNKANDKTTLNYNYNNTVKESKLLISEGITIDNNESGATYPEQAIQAATNTVYNNSTLDCGLVRKYFDLRVDNLVGNINYKINGKEWKSTPSEKDGVYDVAISRSDFYHRFDDYKGNKVVGDTFKPDGNTLANLGISKNNLEVKVTYNLQVVNNSINDNAHKAREVKIKYTYDSDVFELIKVNGETKPNTGSFELTVSNLSETQIIPVEFKVILPSKEQPSNYKLNLEGSATAEIISYTTEAGGLIDNDSNPGNGKEEDDISKRTIKFRFEEEEREISGTVAKDSDANGSLDTEKNKQINGVIVQLIEVIKKDDKLYEYIWQETATGSNIVKARSKDNKEYIYTNNLAATNINGQYQFLGYSATAKDSVDNTTRNNVVGFIPGNYIIRFIYGDGTTAYYNTEGKEVLLTDMTYNGQDYKSTIDSHYNAEEYKESNYNGKSSVARDNEARRLETMAFSVEIDGELGVALNTLNQKELADLTDKEIELLRSLYEKLQQADDADLEYASEMVLKTGNVDKAPEISTLTDSNIFDIVKCYTSFKTWMCAETSIIDVNGDSSKKTYIYDKVNFGLMERPNTELVVEKHITKLRIIPTGTGSHATVDATADINQILSAIDNGTPINATGVTNNSLSIIGSTRRERGFWKVETDIEELAQGAKLELEYTYAIRNKSEADYLSSALVGAYNSLADNPKEYADKLIEFSGYAKKDMKTQGISRVNGGYLGNYYYTGDSTGDMAVDSRVNKFEENLNNQLSYKETVEGAKFDFGYGTEGTGTTDPRKYYTVSGKLQDKDLESVLTNKDASKVLKIEDDKSTEEREDADTSITLSLETTLANAGEQGITIPTYLTEITSYSNAAGRRDKNSVPGNLRYVHSDDNDITLDSYVKLDNDENIIGVVEKLEDVPEAERAKYVRINDSDEFWGESIIISKPTGGDKNTAMIITIIAISGAAVIGAGIILIKKYALKK